MGLSMADSRYMRTELDSLRTMAARTGENLRALIDIPEETRRRCLLFAEQYPMEAHIIHQAFDYRDAMLDVLDREEERAA